MSFLRYFGNNLDLLFFRATNYSFKMGELSTAQQQETITLIPKDNKSRQFLTNYRPICLLNTVYKIASAATAYRIKTVLDKLINENQSGFIAGRFIGESTRTIYDVMQLADEQNIPGLLLLIDFEKAFDTVSW